ncbi:unnamed protein product, partial [Ilex paraguariensis]
VWVAGKLDIHNQWIGICLPFSMDRLNQLPQLYGHHNEFQHEYRSWDRATAEKLDLGVYDDVHCDVQVMDTTWAACNCQGCCKPCQITMYNNKKLDDLFALEEEEEEEHSGPSDHFHMQVSAYLAPCQHFNHEPAQLSNPNVCERERPPRNVPEGERVLEKLSAVCLILD